MGAHVGKIIFGTFWMLIGVLIIGILAVPAPIIGEPRNPKELGLPNDVLEVYAPGGLLNNKETAVVSSDNVVIEFSNIVTLNYHWGGEDAKITVTSPVNAEFPAVSENFSYDQTILDQNSTVTPYLRATLQGNEFLHNWVDGQATMNLIYAVAVSSDKYDTLEKSLTRDFHVYVVTPEEAKVMADMAAYRSSQAELSNRQNNLPWYILFSLGFFVIPGVLLIRYAVKKRKSPERRTYQYTLRPSY